MCLDMYGEMSGAAAWMMTGTWDFPYLLLLWAMWVVMMAGMMLPSATPALLRRWRIRRSSDRKLADVFVFAGGYLAVWTGFATLATVLQRLLTHWSLLSPMMEIPNHFLGGIVFLAAGLYQLTPYKATCLRSCRFEQPPIPLSTGSIERSGFRSGIVNGLSCIGCCWVLMLLLFIVGVMNLWANIALTVFVFVEKVVPFGASLGRVAGVVLGAIGVWYLL
jgi:predicted metal-binding membrane protein